ncbi:MAG TPA: Rieske (2Fe-2S) protein [Anditalea sp.]|nr:Rieske (2Fe-2S) protein [Anditalea sp.]
MNPKLTKSGRLSAERRAFLKKTGSLAVMSLLGVGFFTSCTDDDDTLPDNNVADPSNPDNGITINGNTINIDLTKASSLKAAGGWMLITDAQLLVVNVGTNSYNALTSICTHSQCDRNWTFTNTVFTCTCHGSRFNTSGGVVAGPATAALRSFGTSLSDEILTITKT